MAVIDNNFRTGYILRIYWYVNGQDIANNCSNITAIVQLVSTGSSYNIRASATKNGSLYIDGTTYNFTFNATLNGNQTKEIFRKDVTIYHWDGGDRTFGMYATAGINVTLSGTYWGTVRTPSSGESTCRLDTIPRRNTITSITGDWMGSTMTVNIDKKSTGFTSSVYVKTPDSDWYNVAWKDGGTSISFTLPMDLANHVTTATECTGQVLVRTYSGDTVIGEDIWNKWMGVPDSVKPSISSPYTGTNTQVNGTWLYVQNKTKALVTFEDAGSYGSWITSRRVDVDGTSYWDSKEVWTNILRNSGTRSVDIHVWDSRGRHAQWSGTINVVGYQDPWGSLTAFRCDSSGTRDDVNGTFVKVAYSGNKASLNGANTFSIAIDHREPGQEWSAVDLYRETTTNGDYAILGSASAPFSLEKSYDIRLRISDWYTSTSRVVPINTASVLLDFKAGGKGLGVGRVATEDNCAQFATAIKIFAGRNNNPYLGADLVFGNCGTGAHEIGVCGAPPNSSTDVLNVYSFTNDYSILSITRNNDIVNRAGVNFVRGGTIYQGGHEVVNKYDGAPAYQFFNPTWCGYYDESAGEIWTFNYSSKVLTLKSGYHTSDERKKYNIDEFTNWDDFYNFYMTLKPVTFKYNEDMINDTHIGFIAQNIADSIVDNNLANEKLAVVKCLPNEDYDDGREYSVCYQEMIALNTKMIQKHENEILELNNVISQQQDEINQLKALVNQLINQNGK